ncbi:MAG: hypothetical protein IVW55_05155 [Chloroflexi bacterium]|nr:hypothetical protein [Chloroflexota bacterium]
MNGATQESTGRRKLLKVRWIAWSAAILLAAVVVVPAVVWLGRTNPALSASPAATTGQPLQNEGTGSGAARSGTQTNEGGGVTVAVEWAGKDAGPVFKVTIDTHSVDLDGYDLTRLSTLRTDDGREALPVMWDAPKGGHHREGQLTFSANALDGKPLVGTDTKGLELIIYDVAGVAQRSFKWTP